MEEWHKVKAVSPEVEVWQHEPTGIRAVRWAYRDTWDLDAPGHDEPIASGLPSLSAAVRYVENKRADDSAWFNKQG